MVYMRDVIVMNEALLDLIQRDDAGVRGVYGPKSIPHLFKVNVPIVSDVIYDELQSL